MRRSTEYLTLEKHCANLIVDVLSGSTLLRVQEGPQAVQSDVREEGEV